MHIRTLYLTVPVKPGLLDSKAVDNLLCCRAITQLQLYAPLFPSRSEMQRLVCGFPNLEDLCLLAYSGILQRRNPYLPVVTRAKPSPLRKLSLLGWPPDARNDIDFHHTVFISWLKYINATKALEEINFWVVLPGDLYTLQTVLEWELIKARMITLNLTGGLKAQPSLLPKLYGSCHLVSLCL